MTNPNLLNRCIEFKDELQTVLGEEFQDIFVKNKNENPFAEVVARLSSDKSYHFIIPSNYPDSPPIVIISHGNASEQLLIDWDSSQPLQNRLQLLAERVHVQNLNEERLFGTNGMVLTKDKNLALAAGWTSTNTTGDIERTKQKIQDGIYSRTLGVLSKDIFSKKVLVIGVGSVGSYICDQLVRSGVGNLTIIDPDIVEYSNLSRTMYTIQDVYKPKVKALARHLYNINPSIQLDYLEEDITSYRSNDLISLFSQSDIIVATTDDPQAQRVINRFAYGVGKPAIFIGLYQGADGGEVILSLPEKTPCYQCSTSIRHELEMNSGNDVGLKTDYGTGKLEGVVALSADIHHVTSSAVKIILSLLIPKDSKVALTNFVEPAIDQGFTYLTFSMKDQYWFYPHIFRDVPGQYAYQSVWLTPTRNEECSVCGEKDYHFELEKGIVKVPTSASIRKALE